MRRLYIHSIALALTAAAAGAQDRGGFVTTLGRDTIAMERFAWSDGGLTGDAVLTTPRVQRLSYRVAVGPDQRPTEFALTVKVVNDTNPPLEIRTTIGRDSVRLTRTQGSRVTYRADVAVDAPVLPENLYTWALYELSTKAVANSKTDSTSVWMVSPGGPKPYPKVFNRRAADTLSTMFFYPEYWMNYVVDKPGRLLGIDGAHTTIKVAVVRRPDVPLDAFAAGVAARERTAGAVGALSSADSVTASIGSARVAVAYSRPEKRGRRIWGEVVPFGQIWRTGANSATRLHLSHDAEIGGTRVPAGSYTLFSIPAPDGAMLVINRQVGQWGTEYHADRDLARVQMTASRLPSPVERFTIAVEGAGADGATLVMQWDDVRWSVPVRLAPAK
jgi:hypothetical protein